MSLLWFVDLRTLLICVLVFLVLRWLFRQPKNLPPGPWGFPIIGSIPAIVREVKRGSEPEILFQRYAEKYGPVFCLSILHKTVVVLNDFNSVKEAFQHPQLIDRPHTLLVEALKSNGVITSSGEVWLEQRRFCLNVLRSFGVGKTSFEEKISTEVQELMKEVSALDGKPFYPKSLLGNAVSNIICSVIFGKRYEYSDEEFKELLRLLGEIFKLSGAGGILIFMPSLRHLPIARSRQMMYNLEAVRVFITKVIDKHRAALDADTVNDFIDAYLLEVQTNRKKEEVGEKHGHLSENNLVGTITNLFGAGTETTGTTFEWCIIYMVYYPDIQQKVQAEIDEVVGRNRLPRMADKQELNFTQAVIWEIQRMTLVVPLGPAHTAASDVNFRDFTIPKGTILVPNLWAVAHDPKIWSDPYQFQPGRFLNEKGEAVKIEELIPFSIGRRSCIGEHLAKMEIFVFFTFLMHQFIFKKPDNFPLPSLKGKGGLTNSPLPFRICAIKRD